MVAHTQTRARTESAKHCTEEEDLLLAKVRAHSPGDIEGGERRKKKKKKKRKMRNIICYLSPEFIQTRARRGAGPLRKLRECNHPANPVCFHFVQCFVGERVCISKGRVCLMRCRFWMFNIKNFAHLLTLMLRPLPDWRAANQLVLRLNIGGSTFGNEFSKISRIIYNIYL